MAKKDNTILIVGILEIVAIAFFAGPLGNFVITGNEKIARSMPSTVSPGQTFTVSYIASGTSGTWGASIEDSTSGGCTFPSGESTYKTVMLSGDGNTKQIQVKAPSSGSCVFHGDYKFSEDPIKNMADKSIMVTISDDGNGDITDCSSGQDKCEGTIYHTCSSGDWVSLGQVDGKCGYSTGNGDGNRNGNGDVDEEEVPTFDLNKVLFNLGTFGVTAMYIIIFLVSLLAIKFLFSKK